MSSKSKKIENKKTVAVNEKSVLPVASKEPVTLVDDKEFKDTRSKSGNPFLVSNVATRLYENERENGSTAIFLGILSFVPEILKGEKRILDADDLDVALKTARERKFEGDGWKRLSAIYDTLGAAKWARVTTKIGAVYNPVKAGIRTGFYRGVNVERLASKELRAKLGYTF